MTLAALVLLLPSARAIDLSIPLAESYFVCNGRKTEGGVIVSDSRSFTVEGDGGSFFCAGLGAAVNRNPFIHLQADVHGGSRSGLSVQADIQVEYFYAIHEKSKTPRPNKIIPHLMSVTGSVDSSAEGSTNRASFISIYANLSFQAPVLVAFTVGNGVLRETEPVPLSSGPDQLMHVRYVAQCYLQVGKGESDSCVAEADPLPTFDQVRFDADNARLGLSTFTLSDYYDFRFSPNMVPEPSTWLMCFIGLVVMAAQFGKRAHDFGVQVAAQRPARVACAA